MRAWITGVIWGLFSFGGEILSIEGDSHPDQTDLLPFLTVSPLHWLRVRYIPNFLQLFVGKTCSHLKTPSTPTQSPPLTPLTRKACPCRGTARRLLSSQCPASSPSSTQSSPHDLLHVHHRADHHLHPDHLDHLLHLSHRVSHHCQDLPVSPIPLPGLSAPLLLPTPLHQGLSSISNDLSKVAHNNNSSNSDLSKADDPSKSISIDHKIPSRPSPCSTTVSTTSSTPR